MKLEIIRYNEDYKDAWDNFIKSSINGTFLHSRAFYNHNPQNKLDDCSFIYLKKNKIVGALPCIFYTKGEKNYLHSHLRSTYGGFVVNSEVGVEEAVEMVEKLKDQATALQVSEIIVRNPFRIFHKKLCDETDYAMWYHGFELKSRELEIAIDLQGEVADLKKRYNNGTKYNVKKAVKSVSVGISEEYKIFWNILEQNLLEKHGQKPVHGHKDFEKLLQNVGNDHIKLFAGYTENKLICGVVVFLFGNEAIHAQYIGADSTYQELRPLNAVIDNIIEWGNHNGYAYFNLGMANEDGGKSINYGLYHFKEGFGGRGILRETMSYMLN